MLTQTGSPSAVGNYIKLDYDSHVVPFIACTKVMLSLIVSPAERGHHSQVIIIIPAGGSPAWGNTNTLTRMPLEFRMFHFSKSLKQYDG